MSTMKYPDISDEDRKVGDRIRMERRKNKMNQKQFSEYLGFSESYLGALERGTRQISRNVLKALHDKMDLSYDYIMEGTKEYPFSNHVREDHTYRVKRDVSIMLSTCTADEIVQCRALLLAYLGQIRNEENRKTDSEEEKKRTAAIPQGNDKKQ